MPHPLSSFVGRGVRSDAKYVGRGVFGGLVGRVVLTSKCVGRGVFSLIGLGVFMRVGAGSRIGRVGFGVFGGLVGFGLMVLDGRGVFIRVG